ncbi:staygreen family protein [Neobacillus fumarioli]|uniref:staygreen family protein n=1 Tax=Neobacillus fumarioli TaxID=105229 RepID=UPI0008335EFB|nr:staygreen family protein [Neobacillus fumarioli]
MKEVLQIIEFKASKLHTEYLSHTNEWSPIIGRKYTLTHSDTTGDLFLTIGNHYNLAAINLKIRDEVVAEWIRNGKQFIFIGKVYISGGEFDEYSSKQRFLIFQNELKLALTAIFYGDRIFFRYHPELLSSSVYILFKSIYPQFNQILYYGTPQQYLNSIPFQDIH